MGNENHTNGREVYPPATKSGKVLLHKTTAVTSAASVALDGQLYVFGGNNGTGDVATVQVYDPHKNKWRTLLTLLPAPISGSSGVVVYGLAFMEAGDGSGTANQYSVIAPTIP